MLNRKILLHIFFKKLLIYIDLSTGQNSASLTHTLKLEMLDMVNVKKEYAAHPGARPDQRQQYFEGRMIP